MTFRRRSLVSWAFGLAMRLSDVLGRLPALVTPPPFRLMQIGSAFWQSCALNAAARLDVAGALGDGCLPLSDLATKVGAEPSALGRLLRMLTSLGVFEEAIPGIWRNNRLSMPLRPDVPGSVRAVVLMHNAPEMSRPWYEQLEPALRDGAVPFELAHGEGMYALMDRNAALNSLFSQAMDQVEAVAGPAFATDFDWRKVRRVIDVGGSRGSKSLTILRHHPHLRALVVDRESVIAEARTHWAGREEEGDGLSRPAFAVGDVLESVPTAEEGDAYFLSAVLHGFDDDQCVKALSVLAEAARPVRAPIVLFEMVMPEERTDFVTASFDMQMFMATRGKERSLAEWRRLFVRAGVELAEMVRLASPAKMLVLYPSRMT